MRTMKGFAVSSLAILLAWLLAGATALAADPAAPASAAKFAIGDVAPPLAPLAWIKGEPVESLRRNRVYVVAFFATWCGASRQSMPLLSAAARRYRDDVTVIGINVRESERGKADVAAVTQFVEGRGRDMDYHVAMDDPVNTPLFQSWMRAAGMYAIPTAFIIGRDGRLAYVGIPIDPDASFGFEQALQQAVDGASDLTAARRLQGELIEQMAQYLADRELTKTLDAAMARKDYRAVLIETDRLITQDPGLAPRVFGERLTALLHLDEAAALAYARKTAASARSVEESTAIAGGIGTVIAHTPGLSRGAYEMAVSNLETVIARPGNEFNAIFDLDTLAQLQHRLGRRERAIEAQRRAVDLARGRTDVSQEIMAKLQSTLADYTASHDPPAGG